ncbi:MAG: hypothetical protein WBQ23_14735 [Bacteroidota bacterium]
MKHVVLLLLLITSAATAQVGTWHTYTDMKLVRDLVAGKDGFWAATSGGVFHTFPDGSFERYTNIDGLSAIDYTAVAMDENGVVIAGSTTGMINVFVPGSGWYEVSDIARAEEIPSRGITTIKTHQGKAYIGTEFGLAVYDLERREFGDTYQKFGSLPLRSKVNAVQFDGDEIWVATSAGIALGDLKNLNLKDPDNWTSWDNVEGRSLGDVRDIFVAWGAPMAIVESNTIISFNGNEWVPKLGSPGGTMLRLASHGSFLYLMTDLALYELEFGQNPLLLGDMLNSGKYPPGARFMDIEIAGDGRITLGSNFGIVMYEAGSDWTFSSPDGPNSNFFRALSVDDGGTLWAASGITDGGRGAYAFDGTDWSNLTIASDPRIGTDAITDATPADGGAMWFATWGDGVFRREKNGDVTIYNGKNVAGFPGITDNTEYAAVRSVQLDSRGNLWVLHYLSSSNMLGCMTPTGQWYFFSDPGLPSGMIVTDLMIDQFNQLWILLDDGAFRGILIFNNNGTLTNPSDDTWTRLRANDANVINAEEDATAVAVDLLGDMWIGTDRGIRTVFNPTQPDRVSKTCFNTRCNVEGQYITSIAIDPVNNKWLGTKEGVFVLTADGSEILAHYDTDNSPLLDDEIQTLIIHPTTGVAYIATPCGLSSLATAFVQPQTTFGELSVGPNPFRPGIDEHVMIDGLVEASIIKVLSVSGNLVKEILTPGGRVGFWDGRTSTGEYAPSGVYFIIAAAPNGSQSAVAKVAVVRE